MPCVAGAERRKSAELQGKQKSLGLGADAEMIRKWVNVKRGWQRDETTSGRKV
jgi:hypothetical protein